MAVVVRLRDDDIRSAMRCYFSAAHNVAEGAGALALAAVIAEQPASGRRIVVVLSGGNDARRSPEFHEEAHAADRLHVMQHFGQDNSRCVD
ncbi:MAG: hypothetical protein ABIT36_07850 [Steroidobacteraceae bacterium]